MAISVVPFRVSGTSGTNDRQRGIRKAKPKKVGGFFVEQIL